MFIRFVLLPILLRSDTVVCSVSTVAQHVWFDIHCVLLGKPFRILCSRWLALSLAIATVEHVVVYSTMKRAVLLNFWQLLHAFSAHPFHHSLVFLCHFSPPNFFGLQSYSDFLVHCCLPTTIDVHLVFPMRYLSSIAKSVVHMGIVELPIQTYHASLSSQLCGLACGHDTFVSFQM